MRNPRILMWFSVLCALALLAGCGGSDKGTNPPPNTPADEPTLQASTIIMPTPLLSSQNPKAQVTANYVNEMNGFSNYLSFFNPQAGGKGAGGLAAADGPPWEHTWTNGGLTITMTVDQVETHHDWDIVLDGTDGAHTYSQWLFIHSEQAVDGTSGSFIVYEPGTTDVQAQWTWSMNAQDVCDYEMIVPESEKLTVAAYPDSSGDLEVYEPGGKTWNRVMRVEWESDGSGQWWEYVDDVETDSDSWTPGEEPAEPPPGLTATPVTVPAHMLESQDSMAMMAVAYVDMANSMSSLVDTYFTPPGGKACAVKTDGPPWEYTWTDSSLTVTMTIDEMVGGYQWEIVLDGTDGFYAYSDWLMMSAEQTTDGSSGSMILYQPVTTEIDSEWSWSTDAYGVYTFVMTTYGSPGSRIEIVVNLDQSGSIDFYDESGGAYEMVFRVEWAADGTGSYWMYSGGVEQDSGTWAKG